MTLLAGRDVAADPDRHRGRAAQVDPIKPTLKAPGTKRLKLKCDDPLLSFGFNFNLRHCIVEQEPTLFSGSVHDNIAAGKVGRCRLTVLNPS